MNKGTPKTLRGAIENAATEIASGKSKHAFLRDATESHTVDFLAQKFAVAIMKANAEQAESVAELWESITGRKIGER